MKFFYFSDAGDDEYLLLSVIYDHNPSKFLAVAFSLIGITIITPLLYLIILFEQVIL
jgi:hypothetical protein